LAVTLKNALRGKTYRKGTEAIFSTPLNQLMAGKIPSQVILEANKNQGNGKHRPIF